MKETTMELKGDYYEMLGIVRTASVDEIKKAYRKSALRWHPDKNLDNRELAEANFKKVAEAYEVLSDDRKRRIYDQYGQEGLSDSCGSAANEHSGFPGMSGFFGAPGSSPFGGMFGFSFRNPNDVFEEFFGSNFFEEASFNGPSHNGSASNSHSHQNPASMFMDPFNMLGAMGGAFQTMNSMNIHMGSSQGNGPNVKRVSTSIKKVNGKTIETKRVVDNGVETVTVIENGKVKSQTVNGQPMLK